MTQGHCGEFHLLLLCLCNVFFFFTQEKPHVPPTHAAILSPLTLSPPSSPPWQMHLRPRKKRKKSARAQTWQTHTGPNQPSVTNMLMTLHSNKSNDFQSQTSEGASGAAIIAPPPRNIQQHGKQQTRDQWFIRVSVVLLAPRLIHKHKAHSQKKGNSTSERGVMPRGSNGANVRASPQLSVSRLFTCFSALEDVLKRLVRRSFPLFNVRTKYWW